MLDKIHVFTHEDGTKVTLEEIFDNTGFETGVYILLMVLTTLLYLQTDLTSIIFRYLYTVALLTTTAFYAILIINKYKHGELNIGIIKHKSPQDKEKEELKKTIEEKEQAQTETKKDNTPAEKSEESSEDTKEKEPAQEKEKEHKEEQKS